MVSLKTVKCKISFTLPFIALFFLTPLNFWAKKKDPLSIVVIGGGPTGLATAIEAKMEGAMR
ncbi:MAG TPA: hypothetical protein VGJ00_03320 [Rhabdochlamydiaceae bacterium]|jgi:NADPH-dependent 2,4-dienoyl-CoA reductase/sulfur reductase-like enzyme